MRHPYVEITDSAYQPRTFKHVYCHDALAPQHGGFQAGTIERVFGNWSFQVSPTCDTLLDAEDRANLYIVVDEYIAVLKITDRLLK